uniref:Uncharacterized protein n=1 Tax=viral metagenome TaxID=1070528 RepID=A0A6C0JZ23_9ZZZZ
MSSVTRFLKQIPSDGQYFVPVSLDASNILLNYFTQDANSSTMTYVSGAAAGSFTTSNARLVSSQDPNSTDLSGSLFLFRDMGKTIISSARTFRRVQLLQLNGVFSNNSMNGGWTSSNTSAGGWAVNNEGVVGAPSTNLRIDSDFGCFYFETGARGLGIAQGLIRYG